MNRPKIMRTPKAFTLIELLVVIVIILLLVGILLPTISEVKKLAAATKCKTRIQELSDGIKAFTMDSQGNPSGLLPGQESPGDLESGGDFEYNGSKLLAAILKAGDYGVTFNDEDILANDAISDRFTGEPMPVLYYPSRLNKAGLDQYVLDDNLAHTRVDGKDVEWVNPTNEDNKGDEQKDFEEYIKDRRFEDDSTTPYNTGKFLLISAGIDRKFGTSDDITNW